MPELSKLIVKVVSDSAEFAAGMDQAKSKATQFKDSFKQIAAVAGTVGAAVLIAKKAMDMGAQGQQLIKVRERFEALSVGVGDYRDMLMGLREVTRGQATDTELMNGANLLLQTGLATTKDELLKHYEIVASLKKPHEELGAAIENWSLMLANRSIQRLDSYGISAGKVRDRVNELKLAGLNADEAFKQATFEQAQIAMERLGNDVPIDEFAEFKTNVGNLTDAAKIAVAEGLGPLVGALNDLITQAPNVIQAIDDIEKEFIDLAAAGEKIEDGQITTHQGFEELIDQLILASDSYEDYIRLVENLPDDLEFEAKARERVNESYYNAVKAIETYQKAQAEAADADQVMLQNQIEIVEMTDEEITMLGRLNDTNLAYREHRKVVNDELERGSEVTEELTDDTDALREATLAAAQAFNTDFMDALGEIIQAEADGESVTYDFRQEMFEAAQQAGVSETALYGLAMETGNYTAAQIQAALKTAAIREEIGRLAGQVADGNITWMEANEQLEAFISGLDRVPTGKTFTWTIDWSWGPNGPPPETWSPTTPDMPGGGAGVGGAGQPSGGGGGNSGGPGNLGNPEFQHGTGGWLTVPQGFDDTPYYIGLHSGEPYRVVSRQEVDAGGAGMGGTNIYVTVQAMSSNPVMLGDQIAGAVAARLGGRTR